MIDSWRARPVSCTCVRNTCIQMSGRARPSDLPYGKDAANQRLCAVDSELLADLAWMALALA